VTNRELITGEKFGAERAAPRAHLLAEAQKPFSELQADLAAAHDNLRSVLQGVTDPQSRFQPSSGEGEDAWGIAQVLRHLGGSEGRFAKRVLNLGRGDEMGAPAPQPGDDDPRSLEELKKGIEESYQALLGAANAVAGSENLEPTWNHPMFGELNCRAVFALQSLHTNDHARQIARLKAMPDFPKA
jgi:hypothetical protein